MNPKIILILFLVSLSHSSFGAKRLVSLSEPFTSELRRAYSERIGQLKRDFDGAIKRDPKDTLRFYPDSKLVRSMTAKLRHTATVLQPMLDEFYRAIKNEELKGNEAQTAAMASFVEAYEKTKGVGPLLEIDDSRFLRFKLDRSTALWGFNLDPFTRIENSETVSSLLRMHKALVEIRKEHLWKGETPYEEVNLGALQGNLFITFDYLNRLREQRNRVRLAYSDAVTGFQSSGGRIWTPSDTPVSDINRLVITEYWRHLNERLFTHPFVSRWTAGINEDQSKIHAATSPMPDIPPTPLVRIALPDGSWLEKGN